METVSRNNVTLSANATANAVFLAPCATIPPFMIAGLGDYAGRREGRERRRIRRDRISAKRSFLTSEI